MKQCVMHVLALAIAGGFAATTLADEARVDLNKIEREIAAEPKYEAEDQSYCLMVFGPKAEHTAWLVLDGNRLFVDRNGNGDLTDDGAPAKADSEGFGGDYRVFQTGPIEFEKQNHDAAAETEEAITYNDLILYSMGEHTGLSISADGKRVAFSSPKLADSAADAPIVHFDGPLEAKIDSDALMLSRSRATEVYVMIGTPGLGEGSFASISYAGLPANLKPQIELVASSRDEGSEPIREVLILPGRC